eukprot:c27856_g1_i1 orf=1-162(-)
MSLCGEMAGIIHLGSGEELRSRGFALSIGALCQKNNVSVALPVGIQDEGAAFVA